MPDSEYYQEIIESRWAEVEPDIKLVRADWDCYYDGAPEGIDVVMFDAVMRDAIVESGWIQPIEPEDIQENEDFFPFAMEGLTVDGKLYGIPAFLCGNFLIYDQDNEMLAAAEHITDLEGMDETLVVNSENSDNRPQYAIEVVADTKGEANPSVDINRDESMQFIDRLAIDAHKQDDDTQVAKAYDSGIGQGYIGFSESIRLLNNRKDKTRIKSISFSDKENIYRLYADAAAITAGVKGQRYEKCLELINIMTDEEVLTELSVKDGAPQYLLLARRSPYQILKKEYLLYEQLENLAANEKNNVILTP